MKIDPTPFFLAEQAREAEHLAAEGARVGAELALGAAEAEYEQHHDYDRVDALARAARKADLDARIAERRREEARQARVRAVREAREADFAEAAEEAAASVLIRSAREDLGRYVELELELASLGRRMVERVATQNEAATRAGAIAEELGPGFEAPARLRVVDVQATVARAITRARRASQRETDARREDPRLVNDWVRVLSGVEWLESGHPYEAIDRLLEAFFDGGDDAAAVEAAAAIVPSAETKGAVNG